MRRGDVTERTKAILHLRKEGLTNDEIGQRLGVTPKRVSETLRRHGMTSLKQISMKTLVMRAILAGKSDAEILAEYGCPARMPSDARGKIKASEEEAEKPTGKQILTGRVVLLANGRRSTQEIADAVGGMSAAQVASIAARFGLALGARA